MFRAEKQIILPGSKIDSIHYLFWEVAKVKVLVVNCGSSSLKYQLFNMEDESVLAKGLVDRIGLDGSVLNHQPTGKPKVPLTAEIKNHTIAIKMVLEALAHPEHGVVSSIEEIDAIGHRVVHGAEKFSDSVLISPAVMSALAEFTELAPLHNPPNISGINACAEILPKVPQVGVFDTAFHQTMPEEAFLYALPYSMYKEHGVRRYGAHGTSHYYVSREVAKELNIEQDKINVITCHLGNGGSVAAIRHGECIDTSMGLTPLEGLVMGTRSGDIDPAIIFYMYNTLGMNMEEIENTLTKKSGLLGLTEVTSDCRYAEDNYETKADAKRAIDVYSYRLAKYIGSYMAVIGERLDAIVFTGGIGENSAHIRELTLAHLKLFGYELDMERNLAARFGKSGKITSDKSPLALVIPTNEELVIAQDTARLAVN